LADSPPWARRWERHFAVRRTRHCQLSRPPLGASATSVAGCPTTPVTALSRGNKVRENVAAAKSLGYRCQFSDAMNPALIAAGGPNCQTWSPSLPAALCRFQCSFGSQPGARHLQRATRHHGTRFLLLVVHVPCYTRRSVFAATICCLQGRPTDTSPSMYPSGSRKSETRLKTSTVQFDDVIVGAVTGSSAHRYQIRKECRK